MNRASAGTAAGWPSALLVVLLLAALAPGDPAPHFLPDDPLTEDADRLDVPAPSVRPASEIYDFLVNSFATPGRFEGPALNVNTVGDVPASSWFEERHYREPMPASALQRGPDRSGGPSRSAPWHVVKTKRDGKSTGLHMIDATGERYLLKFDPVGYPELTTGAEVIATKFLHAFGFFVPENHLVVFDPAVLVPDTAQGVTRRDVDLLIERVPTAADGHLRALASRIIPGPALGPFLFHGTRPDDPNDIFPHEARRELRGLRLVAAWLNLVDTRSKNTLSVLARDGGRQYVRHFLLDFGSALGASALGPQRIWSGHVYAVPAMLQRLVAPVADFSWEEVSYPSDPAVGRFEAAHFDPASWVPQYPNPAFSRMTADDAFWAAARIVRFTDGDIRAVVSTGRYSDPEVAAYLARTLALRRDRIARAYLHHGGGLDRFRVEGDALVFDDLAARHAPQAATGARTVTWHVFENGVGTTRQVFAGTVTGTTMPLPSDAAPYLRASIRTPALGVTNVYVRRTGGVNAVVGVERCGGDEPCSTLAARQAARRALFAAGH